MNIGKIANFIKLKRNELGLTQKELAEKLFVTEKAVSRWETGKGTPDISLLTPLSIELGVDVSELLNGEENIKCEESAEKVIEYNNITKANKKSSKFIYLFYVLSILSFLIYLKFEYNPKVELNYFVRLFIIIFASILIIIGNVIYSLNYAEKIADKNKVTKLSQIIVFIYYIILLFNMTVFARYNANYGYNIIPFKSITEILNGNLYSIIINIFGNFIIFMPLEYFIMELFKIKGFALNLLVAIIVIFLTEMLQFTFKVGVFDVDDIILCVCGMMVFNLCYRKINSAFEK